VDTADLPDMTSGIFSLRQALTSVGIFLFQLTSPTYKMNLSGNLYLFLTIDNNWGLILG
jgi:hypothetical protein